jgi:uncharacterized protein (DUF1330 family)
MLYLLVKLYVRPGKTESFRAYERKALALFRRYGGEVVAAFSPEPGAEGADRPDEIHVLSVANRSQFDDYLADPDRQAMAAERDSVLLASETIISLQVIRY